jgi:hypothetical protein
LPRKVRGGGGAPVNSGGRRLVPRPSGVEGDMRTRLIDPEGARRRRSPWLGGRLRRRIKSGDVPQQRRCIVTGGGHGRLQQCGGGQGGVGGLQRGASRTEERQGEGEGGRGG